MRSGSGPASGLVLAAMAGVAKDVAMRRARRGRVLEADTLMDDLLGWGRERHRAAAVGVRGNGLRSVCTPNAGYAVAGGGSRTISPPRRPFGLISQGAAPRGGAGGRWTSGWSDWLTPALRVTRSREIQANVPGQRPLHHRRDAGGGEVLHDA